MKKILILLLIPFASFAQKNWQPVFTDGDLLLGKNFQSVKTYSMQFDDHYFDQRDSTINFKNGILKDFENAQCVRKKYFFSHNACNKVVMTIDASMSDSEVLAQLKQRYPFIKKDSTNVHPEHSYDYVREIEVSYVFNSSDTEIVYKKKIRTGSSRETVKGIIIKPKS